MSLIGAGLSSSLRGVPDRTSAYAPSALRLLVLLLLLGWGVDGDSAWARTPVPLGVAYGIPLDEGQWSLSYTYRREEGTGLRDEQDRVSAAAASSAESSEIGTRLDSDIHTFGVRYSPVERLTLALKLPFIEREMRNRSFAAGGGRYTTKSSGLGDLEVAAQLQFMKKGDEALDLYAGVRLPTGEISEKDAVPGDGQSGSVLLPRPLQTGSRSVALLAGLTYHGDHEALGWGVHANGSIGVEDNDRHYRHGDTLSFSAWFAADLVARTSASLRFGYDHWRRHRGERRVGPDDHLASLRSTTAGERFAISPGMTFVLPFAGEQRLSFEASWPVYQDLEGPQIERDWTLHSGWEWVF